MYRALDFLLQNGLVHRIESLNAYVGCGEPGEGHSGQFLICRTCHRVAELEDPAISALIVDKAERLIPLHPVTQYEGATQLSVGERVVGRESALCLGLSRVAPLRA